MFTTVITNPPFGDIKHIDNLDMFILRARRRECLFVELCINSANQRVAVIVPNSFLSCRRDKPIRKWILENFRYKATISLPRKAFWQRGVRSSTQTHASVMIIDKIKPKGNYKVFMAITETVGDFKKVLQHWKEFDLFWGARMSKELKELIQRTKVAKYTKSNPRKLMLGIVNEIKMKTGHYGPRAWEIAVEYLARWLVLNKKTGLASTLPLQGFKGLNLDKDKIYKHLDGLDLFRHYYVAAKAKPWDYLGEVRMVDLEYCPPGQNMTPRNIVEFMTQMTYAAETRNPVFLNGDMAWLCFNSCQAYRLWYILTYHAPALHLRPMELPIKTQLDPCVGTGRFLIVASQMFPKANLILFGIEIAVSLYQACLVNMAMFSNHPFSIICADTLRLDPDKCGSSSKLWDLGNQWKPADISSFYWKPPPIWHDRFSLEHFVKIKKK